VLTKNTTWESSKISQIINVLKKLKDGPKNHLKKTYQKTDKKYNQNKRIEEK